MKVRISKMFDFDAAHHLPMVPPEHRCHRLHGHTYRVEVFCEGEVDHRGMVCDYAEISRLWAPLHDVLDHRCLNDIDGLGNPTTEVLAPFILRYLESQALTHRNGLEPPLPIIGVRVYESSSTWCEVFR